MSHSLLFRSSHLPGDYAQVYGSADHPHCCGLCGQPVFSPGDDFGALARTECRWRHIEHLLFSCCVVTPPGDPGINGFSALRADLYAATALDDVARAAVVDAFPPGDSTFANAVVYSVPFVLDLVHALRSRGRVPASIVHSCAHIVAA